MNNKKCSFHQNNNFLFYCFEDKKFLCNECFREHKNHKIEIKDDIQKVSDFIQNLKKSNLKELKPLFNSMEKQLNDLKNEIEKYLLEIQKLSEKFKENEQLKIFDKEIFEISYQDFNTLFDCISIKSKLIDVSEKVDFASRKIKNNFKENIIPGNFKIINKEVSVIENSEIYNSYSIDILLGKSSSYEYTLFQENKKHYLILDLGKKYYLKSIKIQVTIYDCSLKSFSVLVKDNKEDNWNKINDFVKERETQNNNNFQSFDIGYFCKLVKFIFNESWGISNGNFILIKKIDFEVGE